MNDIIVRIVAKELKCDVNSLRDDSGWNKTIGWDSLAQIGIISSIEESFSIIIPDEMITQLVDIKNILEYVEQNLQREV